MKTILKSLVGMLVLIILTAFSFTTGNVSHSSRLNEDMDAPISSSDEVVITYDSTDVINLEKLGEIRVTEKWLFYDNNAPKEKTLLEFKKRAKEKGGDMVFIDLNKRKGFGIFFSITLVGNIYKNQE